jgi:hypothetical protein
MFLLEEILASVVTGSIVWLYPRRVRTARGLQAVVRGRRRLRISFSALLRVEHDGRFLLLRQGLHRPDQLGPLGGVYKALGEGVPTDFDFRHLTVDDHRRARDISDDLRGTIPSFRLPQFIRWFERRRGRESDALHRELLEELAEAGAELPPGLFPLRTELMHVAEEGPVRVRESDPVYRRHEVYRLRHGAEKLIALAATSDQFRLVSEDEIRRGRTTDNITIGDQTAFLLSTRPLTGARHF